MDDLANLFTIERLIAFLLGVGVTYVYHYVKCVRQHTKFPKVKWQMLGIVLGIGVITFSFFEVERLSAQTKECQREFNDSLRIGRKVAEENDLLSIEQRELFLQKDRAETEMWFKLVAPSDPAISALDTNHPRRAQYGLDVVREYQQQAEGIEDKIKESQRKQAILTEERRQNPLPEPTCGK